MPSSPVSSPTSTTVRTESICSFCSIPRSAASATSRSTMPSWMDVSPGNIAPFGSPREMPRRSFRRSIGDGRRVNGTDAPWTYIALAPHFQREHGVFREMRSEILERFPCRLLAGYELGDDKLPEEVEARKKPGKFLLPFMEDHRQAFFHASDAYSIVRAWSALYLDEARKPAHRGVASGVHRERFANANRLRAERGRRTASDQRRAGRDVEQSSLAEGGRDSRSGFVFRRRKRGYECLLQPGSDLHHRRQHDRKEHASRRPSGSHRGSACRATALSAAKLKVGAATSSVRVRPRSGSIVSAAT